MFRPTNNIRRLALGFGVIALGFFAALPFRRAATDPVAVGQQPVPEDLELGKDLPLQVPGQKPLAGRPSSGPTPSMAVDRDADVSDSRPPTLPSRSAPARGASRPPALPDQYQSLYHPGQTRPRHRQGAVPVLTRNERPEPQRRHTIHDGDTLESLSLRYLGTPERAREIFDANPVILTNPAVLPIGTEIVIPNRRTPPALAANDRRSGGRGEQTEPLPLTPLPSGLQRQSQ